MPRVQILIALIFCSLYLKGQILSEVNLTHNQWNDRYASYSPDGDRIVYESDSAGNWDIFIMDVQGKSRHRLTSSTANDRRPSWHPNGRKILFESDSKGVKALYTINLRNNRIKKITGNSISGELIFASYAPARNRIAVSLQESETKSNIVLLNKNGKIIHHITKNAFRNYYPRWSINGKEIVFFSRKDTDNEHDEIYRTNLDTRECKRLTSSPTHNFCPTWSRDQRKIVYVTSMPDTRPEIFVMNADGSNPIRLTNNDDGDTLPIWHPKKDKILITGYRNGNFEICELTISEDAIQ